MGICFPTNRLRQPPTHPSKLRDQTHYHKPQYYVKWKGYPLEESTWEPLSNLTNAQEAIQLYLNKKNQEGGSSEKEGDDVRIDNFSPLELLAQEWELNPEPGFPQALGQRTARPTTRIFLGSSPCKLMLKKTTCPEK
ncbi:M-phase phosphoprotein 8 [Entomophthora muscae]|uniref:M-phase phosphoprotein 8 n=1 Tax=Entomophthora muscae TaxID=34485 RepID=A0ACC2SP09_9FUNG|nr:M-phase phosphoprotein 8 [Entomophthora muscae]